MTTGTEEAFTTHAMLRTDDLDEAREALTATYLPVEARYLGRPGPLGMRLNVLRLGASTAGFIAFDRDVRLSSPETTDYHINFPLSGHAESTADGMEPVSGTVAMGAVFRPGVAAAIRWGGGCGQVCLKFPPHTVHSELERLLGRPAAKPVVFQPALDLTTTAGQAWLRTLRLAEADSRRPDGLLSHPLAVETVKYLLLDGLLLGQPNTYSAELLAPRRPAPNRAIAQAVALLEDQPEQPWTPALLASAVALSVRALHDGFQRCTGFSPMNYLREIRLARVNAELSAAAPGTTVTGAAGRWGFVHMGRFAETYRAKYGELPSKTLRLSRGR
ncbi:AraC-type DNA-binding protein [Amycolatopsis xylanica]|uniref:AraC-type DNA-binding protein n=1 Tax=Amycolatopsis xylanica TaxID=589385 RepID=A0A1H3NFU9_9PSEU|nr:AraC family transcriptional regulator [Amycolatopsis xylanica]SDY87603.1 AraC-type DNA-binding protein [Amycolatopsis xylanica]